MNQSSLELTRKKIFEIFNKNKKTGPIQENFLMLLEEFGELGKNTIKDKLSLVVLLTTYCSICLDLLEQIKDISMDVNMSFLLIIEGAEKEIVEIRRYYNLDVPIVTVEKGVLELKFRIPATPYAYLLSSESNVIIQNSFDTLKELEALANNSY
ncbi:hypothetical protein A7K91_20775 [Paenibacillus oryzae]|uniref:Alkyl hydroperoxide reductase subunit C/ Thiol specific antioxidant domain-containing protein n=1 Tax=Paenibacillus oryzae TaxID=1844972 RepID=A0A1A5YKM6_9BACL|nr:hypothetical protein [Paenibacillus oryzae]OBR66172.1 hypothetical protein A7K91_20775 [Paenibacillus oryzae]